MSTVDIALEASTRSASVAACVLSDQGPERPAQRFGARNLDPEQAHASDLLPALDDLLAELGCKPSDIGLVCVGLGPGSYTGVRVAIALAKGIAFGGHQRICGVPSIEAELFEQLRPGEVGSALRDARGGRYTLGTYRRGEDGIEQAIAPAAVPVAQLAGALRTARSDASTSTVLLAEPGLPEALTKSGVLPGDWFSDPGLDLRELQPATAGAVLTLGRARSTPAEMASHREVLPLYLAEFVVRPRSR